MNNLPIIIEMAEAYNTTEKIPIHIVCAADGLQLKLSILDDEQNCITSKVVQAKGNVYEHQFDSISDTGMYSMVVTAASGEEATTSFLITEPDTITTETPAETDKPQNSTKVCSKRVIGMKPKHRYDFSASLQFSALGFVFGTMGAMISGSIVSTSALSGLACGFVAAIFGWCLHKKNA